jgi:carbon storage regulator
MLVLSRRTEQSIVLPGLDITVRVLAIQGNTVRIGIEAPRNVQIVREELLDQAQAEPGIAAALLALQVGTP